MPIICNQIVFCISGPALGLALYQAGGFLLPFLVVGLWCMVVAIGGLFVIPNLETNDERDASDRKKLTLLDLAKVSMSSKPFALKLPYHSSFCF